jgi:hypothetical protein
MGGNLTLRAFQQEDLGFLDRLCADPAALGVFEWFGFRDGTWRDTLLYGLLRQDWQGR